MSDLQALIDANTHQLKELIKLAKRRLQLRATVAIVEKYSRQIKTMHGLAKEVKATVPTRKGRGMWLATLLKAAANMRAS